jgi:hypothetical protein
MPQMMPQETGLNPLEAPPPPYDRYQPNLQAAGPGVARAPRLGQPESVGSLITSLNVATVVPQEDRRQVPFEVIRPRAVGESVVFSHQKDYHCKWGPNHGGQPSWLERHKMPHAGELVWLQYVISKSFEGLFGRIKPDRRGKIIDRAGFLISFLEIGRELKELRRCEETIRMKEAKRVDLVQREEINRKILNRPFQESDELKALRKESKQMERKMNHERAVVEGLRKKQKLSEGRLRVLNLLGVIQDLETGNSVVELAQEADISRLMSQIASDEEFIDKLVKQLKIFTSMLNDTKSIQMSETSRATRRQSQTHIQSQREGTSGSESGSRPDSEPEIPLEGLPVPAVFRPLPRKVLAPPRRSPRRVGVAPPQVTINENIVCEKEWRPMQGYPQDGSRIGVRFCSCFRIEEFMITG